MEHVSRSFVFPGVGNRQKVPVNSREGTGFMLTHYLGMLGNRQIDPDD